MPRHQRKEYRTQRYIIRFYGELYWSILRLTIVLRQRESIPLTAGALLCLLGG